MRILVIVDGDITSKLSNWQRKDPKGTCILRRKEMHVLAQGHGPFFGRFRDDDRPEGTADTVCSGKFLILECAVQIDLPRTRRNSSQSATRV